MRWQDLKDLFRKSGTVLRADVALSPDNRSRGYGTVLLASAEDAGRAVDMFNGFNWQGRVLEVRLDRLGVGLGEIDAGVMMVPAAGLGVGISTGAAFGSNAMPGLNAQGLNGAAAQLNIHGLHVPAPQAPLPFVGRQSSGLGVATAPLASNSHPASAALSPAGPALPDVSQNLSTTASPLTLNALSPALIALHQQQQEQQQFEERKREQEELLASASRLGLGAGHFGSLGTIGGGSTGALGSLNVLADLERERARSTGLRSLFVGNVSCYSQSSKFPTICLRY